MNFRSPSTRRDDAALELTPLIDVVFLLLIFFLVTATFAQTQQQSAVPVDLPSGETGDAAVSNERVTIFLASDGSVTLDIAGREPFVDDDMEGLRRALVELRAAEPDTPIYLRGDRAVPYGKVMEVLDLARQVGFRQVFNVVYSDP